jgi:hypothetical protein
MALRQNLIKECKTELGKRDGVWRSVKEKDGVRRFLDNEQQRRYNTMERIRRMLSVMTDAEVNKFDKMAEEAEKPGIELSLFNLP